MNMAQISVTNSASGDDMTAELDDFASVIGLKNAAHGRYSLLLVLALYGGSQSGQLNPAKVVHEIRALEGIESPSQLKPPIQNRHPPLKGLWHKHYLQDGLRSLALNLQKGLKRFGMASLDQSIREAEAAGEVRYFTEADIWQLSNDVTHGNFERLADSAALTGEWLIFAEYEGKKYYLCLGTHDVTTHENLRSQIDAICCHEFPFLRALLANM